MFLGLPSRSCHHAQHRISFPTWLSRISNCFKLGCACLAARSRMQGAASCHSQHDSVRLQFQADSIILAGKQILPLSTMGVMLIGMSRLRAYRQHSLSVSSTLEPNWLCPISWTHLDWGDGHSVANCAP